MGGSSPGSGRTLSGMVVTPGASGRVPLAGSERAAAPGAEVLGPVDPGAGLTVTLVLRRRGDLTLPPGGRLTPSKLAATAGADPSDVGLVVDVLRAHGVEVDGRQAEATRLVRATAPVTALTAVFGTHLERVRSSHPHTGRPVEHRQRVGDLSVPAELNGVVVAVLGLDDRPQARAHFRTVPSASVRLSYTPLQVAQAYAFPAGTDGTGQTVAIIELGGGYDAADLTEYFAGLGAPVPVVTAVGVEGGANAPSGDPSGADGEVLLDVEVAGALAPAARQVVYFAPNSDAGFLGAVTTAAHATPTPTALSISWGQAETSWTAQARTAMDQAFADAAALGITVCVAAGDDGSADNVPGGRPHVDFPAASPHVLACGGTALHWTAAAGVTSETVWNDPGHGSTGGGVSTAFPLPAWQRSAGVPTRRGHTAGRGVPDVAGNADPATGYQVRIDGTDTVIGGTSAVAPLWAALVCRLAQALGRPLGLLQPALYQGAPGAPAGSAGLHDITSGTNGAYTAGPGWDACTGLGTPRGTALLTALRTAGTPPRA